MKYPEHTSTQFDTELMAVCANVIDMSNAVEKQFRAALDSLLTGDLAVIKQVLDDGDLVNAMEIAVDEECTNILVCRQPTANDLRLVSTIIKTINDLERIGDESENIARVSQLFAQSKSATLPCYHQIKYVADVALEMLKASIAAFEALDSDAARTIRHKGALIDDEFHSILRHLVAYMMEDTSELSMTLQTVFVINAIERIGSHAKNISEYVVYMVEGREARNYCTI